MGTVMIRRPETLRAISTGMQVDCATFHATPVFFSRTYCSFVRLRTIGSPRKHGSAIPIGGYRFPTPPRELP